MLSPIVCEARRYYHDCVSSFTTFCNMDGIEAARSEYTSLKMQLIRERKPAYVLRAVDNAYKTFLTNCKELDITAILRGMGRIN